MTPTNQKQEAVNLFNEMQKPENGGKVKGIEHRVFRNDLYLVCKCGNLDAKHGFNLYKRGGSNKPEDHFLMCKQCKETLPWAEHVKRVQPYLDKINENKRTGKRGKGENN
jgi:hypothetical protein